ncbi:TPA: TnsD family Tn7-like transposition protein [Yersinia enterocolitica]
MCLPDCLPDELLLSRLIRHVMVSGDNIPAFTRKTFGSERSSIHPFLTAGLENMANVFGENPETILWEQTLAPLFMFFEPEHAKKLWELMLANEGAKALRESQLPSFGKGSTLHLKWCSLCAKEDLYRQGVSYWHRIHQIPGITACFMHEVLLQEVTLECRQRILLDLLPSPDSPSPKVSSVEYKVAIFSAELVEKLTCKHLGYNVSKAYRSKLVKLNLITANNSVRRKELMREFITYCEHYRCVINAPLPKNSEDYRYLTQLLTQGASYHPFRHLLFSSWLFESFSEFISASNNGITNAIPRHLFRNESDEAKCIVLLKDGLPLEEIYRLTGKSRCYLKRLAKMNDIFICLKPRILTYGIQQRICQLALAGFHRKRIALMLGISIGSVEQVISSMPGLVKWRKKCHMDSMRRRSRYILVTYLDSHPTAIRKEIKQACNAAYFWLYHNDNEWMNNILPLAVKSMGRIRTQ